MNLLDKISPQIVTGLTILSVGALLAGWAQLQQATSDNVRQDKEITEYRQDVSGMKSDLNFMRGAFEQAKP